VSFSDVAPADYFYAPVLYLACHGVIGGYSDGTFRPYANTTRGQLAKIVVLAFALPIQTPAAGGYSFTDIAPGSTFFAYVETATARGIVGGYACGGTNPQTGSAEPCDGAGRPYYRAANNVTRGQLSKIVVLTALGVRGWTLQSPATATFSDVLAGSTFFPYVETAVCHGMINGYSDGTFRPGANATRGQISKIVYYALGSGAGCGPAATPVTRNARP
jgi:subtilisin